MFRYEFVMEFVKAVSVPLRGVGCFARWQIIRQQCSFPSPCGVWVVSQALNCIDANGNVSVPLRGVGCFENI